MEEVVMHSPSRCSIKTKNAYLRMKNCSPKFKTALRQKYKERVINSRCELTDKFRCLHSEGSIENETHAKDWPLLSSEILKFNTLQNFVECDNNFNVEEELMLEDCVREELTQFENWLLQEYETLWNADENKEIIITCPLCCCGYFNILDSCKNTVFCTKCFLTFKTQRSLLEIQNDIFSEVDKHNLNCTSDPAFVQIPGDDTHSNVCIVCDICAYLQVII